jgi:hypothetical protein
MSCVCNHIGNPLRHHLDDPELDDPAPTCGRSNRYAGSSRRTRLPGRTSATSGRQPAAKRLADSELRDQGRSLEVRLGPAEKRLVGMLTGDLTQP